MLPGDTEHQWCPRVLAAPGAPLPECLTWLQVSELGQRAHLQVLDVEGFSLSPCQVPDELPADHAHAAQVDQGTEEQRHLESWGEM